MTTPPSAPTSPSSPSSPSDEVFDHDPILPPDPVGDDGEPLEPLHDREYRVRAYRRRDDLVLIRGVVRDQKPTGLYFAEDDRPLTIHHMVVELEVRYPTLEIVGAEVVLETHPHHSCPRIEDHYAQLVGLSIARGFTHRVRELFGGPRGCTHTTALLQAMAPVAVQCMWSMSASDARRDGPEAQRDTAAAERWQWNVNTCHVWAEDGEQVERLRAGGEMEPPIWAEERMVSLGLRPQDWSARMRG